MKYPHPIVAYLRVSTNLQDLDTQRLAILRWAKQNGIIIDEFIEDIGSGADMTRPGFRELMERVEAGTVKTIVVVELSRLARSLRTIVSLVYRALEKDVVIVSLRENWLTEALQNEMLRPVIISMFGTLYELERKLISERVKAGMEKAKAQGKHVGRPRKLSAEDIKKAQKLLDQGVPVSRVAARFGVSRRTLYDYFKKGLLKKPRRW